MTFYPHLIDAVEVIVLWFVEINQPDNIEVFPILLAGLYLDAIANLVVELVVRVHHIRAGIIFPVFAHNLIEYICVNLGIDTPQRIAEYFRQYALLHARPHGSRYIILSLNAGVARYTLPPVFRLRQSGACRLFDIVCADE